jgi:hypothetical protein
MTKAWLTDWPWETVTAINSALCKEKNALHKPTSEGHPLALTVILLLNLCVFASLRDRLSHLCFLCELLLKNQVHFFPGA